MMKRPANADILFTASLVAMLMVIVACTPVLRPAGSTKPAESTEAVGASEPVPSTLEAVDGLRRLAESPLSPRSGAYTAWTGSEMLIFRGTVKPCPPPADCGMPPLLDDAAAYAPATDTWRMIKSPGEILGITAVLNGVVYARTADARLVAYRVDTDAWTAVAPPDLNLHTYAWYPMVAFGEELLFRTDPFNPDHHVELPFELSVWNPTTNAVRKLPPAPLPPLFDLHVLSRDDTVFALGAEVVPNPGSEKPSMLIGAEYRDGEGWQRLPDSPFLSSGSPWLVLDGRLICTDGARYDGGQVNNWGRFVDAGGMLDIASRTWLALPDRPQGERRVEVPSMALGEHILSDDGLLFDPRTGRWTPFPDALTDRLTAEDASIIWTGDELIVWGGMDWDAAATGPGLLNDGLAFTPPVSMPMPSR